MREAYRIASRLPGSERYNLADQLRRASTSAILNIAEGYGRYHYLYKVRFFCYARGSMDETLSGFIGCQAVGHSTETELASQRDLCHRALQSLNGYIRYIRRQRQGQQEYGDRALKEPPSAYIPQSRSELPTSAPTTHKSGPQIPLGEAQ